MKFSVVIPTRGDVDLTEIIASYDNIADEVLIWDNSKREDLSVYGRCAMIAEARNDLIVTQDDDCIISDPMAIVDAWWDKWHYAENYHPMGGDKGVVCNMPPEFRHDLYTEHALVGFGAVFHRDAPKRAFTRMAQATKTIHTGGPRLDEVYAFNRTCDVAFTTLTPRVLVDVPRRNLWWAEDTTRMYRQANHVHERQKMLELCLQIRDTPEAGA